MPTTTLPSLPTGLPFPRLFDPGEYPPPDPRAGGRRSYRVRIVHRRSGPRLFDPFRDPPPPPRYRRTQLRATRYETRKPKPRRQIAPADYEPGTRWVKRATARSYQSLPWAPPFGTINLGLYRAEEWQDPVVGERAARKVSLAYVKAASQPGACPVGAFVALQAAGVIRPTVQPPGAVFCPGWGWCGRWKRTGRGGRPSKGEVYLPGPYPDAAAASRAVAEALRAV